MVKLEMKDEWTIGPPTSQAEEINYAEELVPDFTKVPEEILKNELLRNGFKTCQVKKPVMYQLLGEIWNYRKTGAISDEHKSE